MAGHRPPRPLTRRPRYRHLRGQPLDGAGKTVTGSERTVTDGPYAEAKDLVGGFTIILATDLAEAAELSKGCPVFDRGGSVEVRPIMKV